MKQPTQRRPQTVRPIPGPPEAAGPAVRSPSVDTVLLIAALLLIGALGVTVQTIVSPFLIAGAVIYLLYPLRAAAVPRRLIWLTVIIFALWFFNAISGLLTPFLLAYLIAYLLDPVVTDLERRHVPRWLSSLVVVLLLIGGVAAGILFVLPPAIRQFQGIINGMSSIANEFADLLNSGVIFAYLASHGIHVEKAQEAISRELSPRLESMLKALVEGLLGVVTSITALVMHLLNAIIIPFLVFYVLKDFRVISHRFIMIMPRDKRERVGELTARVDRLMGGYIRGAIVVATIQGTVAAVGLWLIGVDYALVLGIMVGLLDFIPYVGFLVSLLVACVVAIFGGGAVLAKVLWVAGLLVSQKMVEDAVLAPRIIGRQVGLHPVLLILALLVFGYFLGFLGLLIAVPATALMIAGVKEWEAVRRARRQTTTA